LALPAAVAEEVATETPVSKPADPASAYVEEIASTLQQRNPKFNLGSDRVANAESIAFKFAKDNPEQVAEIAKKLTENPEQYSDQTGLSPDSIKSIAKQLLSFSEKTPVSVAPITEETPATPTEATKEEQIAINKARQEEQRAAAEAEKKAKEEEKAKPTGGPAIGGPSTPVKTKKQQIWYVVYKTGSQANGRVDNVNLNS